MAGAAVYRLGKLAGTAGYVFIALVSPVIFALDTAGAAENGSPAGSGLFDFPFHAEAAILHVADPSTSGIADGTCVLYLGQADGTLALYDPAARNAWRVPTTAVTIETRGRLADVERVPEGCP